MVVVAAASRGSEDKGFLHDNDGTRLRVTTRVKVALVGDGRGGKDKVEGPW